MNEKLKCPDMVPNIIIHDDPSSVAQDTRLFFMKLLEYFRSNEFYDLKIEWDEKHNQKNTWTEQEWIRIRVNVGLLLIQLLISIIDKGEPHHAMQGSHIINYERWWHPDPDHFETPDPDQS